ncbi:hypothetical protein Q3G72_004916 [Acer saccharum]|nr:hypothetical protein Q3G72_004916 [Acer saccharum]
MCKISLRPHKVDCIVELNPFEANETVLRELRLPKHAVGRVPVSSLFSKFKDVKLLKFPISPGMLPLMLDL